ncbi:hypothetical protein FB451DRAFT_1228190, partial [Mycena latifolia]
MASNARWTYRTEHNSGNDRTPAYVTARCFQAPTQYTPQVPRLNHSDAQSLIRSQCPPTPRIPFLPLPGYPIQYRPRTPDLFPIDLSQPGLSPAEATRLCASLPARTTISVRDIANQVLCNVKTGAVPMTTADLVQFLQHFVGTPLASSISCPGTVRARAPYGSASPAGPRGSAAPPASTYFSETRSCVACGLQLWMSRGSRRGSAAVLSPAAIRSIHSTLLRRSSIIVLPHPVNSTGPILSCSPGHIIAYSIITHSPAQH